MAWSDTHKLETREKILRSAARLFTQQGYDRIGINDVMKDAGLTRGAFYAHFKSKNTLYAESIKTAAKRSFKSIVQGEDTVLALDKMISGYLSMMHRKGEKIYCPLAFLITDISHRDAQVREVYTDVFRNFIIALKKSSTTNSDEKSMNAAVTLIGGLALARAVNDETLAISILENCRASVASGLCGT